MPAPPRPGSARTVGRRNKTLLPIRHRLAPGVLALSMIACGAPSGTAPDAATDGPPQGDAGLPSTCEGGCRATDLTAAFGATTRRLDRAYYGVTASSATLHVEAYRGGDPGCPTPSSPPPDYTLVLGTVAIPTSTMPAGSPGNLLDFVGDLLGGPLGAAATSVTLTPVAANVCATCVGMPAPADPDGLLALEVSLTFESGTITGHLFATHCDSLDTP